jgi:rhamnosyltransferase
MVNKISIIIPTKDGEATLSKLLAMIEKQKVEFSYEVLAVDSGSKDGTLRILEQHDVKIIEISPWSFTHGRARNIGANHSLGRLLIFLNQDATPFDENWLNELIIPVVKNYSVSSYSRQIPYPDLSPSEKIFINVIYPAKAKLITAKDLLRKDMFGMVLFSTVSACIKRHIWERFKFNEEIAACEDQELACRLLEAGFKVSYSPSSKVYHSHNCDLLTTFMRYFDLGWGVSMIPELNKRNPLDTLGKMTELVKTTITCCSASEGIDGILHIITKNLGFVAGKSAYKIPNFARRVFSYTLNKRM